ncbi:asparagine synthase (glutamine-hydrolyzing) [Muriicola sp. Z0-33]|uniref:asparagine synthase (glutamine-hydrolyzing) n=1 Tax=Muriicola sp. Z0-33 TaxID=2816957 RepID=UPI002237ABFF|nr:asparagine synthase (glutamine-hydrolyzing) [Muriicola sp. Z0-33]MCW5517989.1 asparagine synthase (glutamine-hydrolyzing) [Muriicola sp. Z0-33]
MCGIAGFTGFKNNNELAEDANKIQHHRGPDNQSVWFDEYIALAHQRLSIIDLSEAANQPFHKGNLVIVFNGEIYNYKQLQEKLKNEKQVIFSTSSDTEVVLEMYKHFGVQCLDFFLGMFAFAIYNKKSSELIIARDHFGIKPLFYTQIDNTFAFSSELKTLVRIPGFNKIINPKSLVSCINYIWVSGNETMFNDCHKLPPAHYLTYNKNEGVKIIRYWELDDTSKSIDTEQHIVDELTRTIEKSVARHMVADVPVSCFLSGGLDSSLISVLAKKKNHLLSTYTISTLMKDKKIEQMPDDEKYAKIVADTFQFNHNVLQINSDILNELPRIVRALDEPIGDPAAINTYLICKAAKQKGAKVLLSGMGADEIFFGYRRQQATLLALRYNKLPKFVKSITSAVVNRLPVKIFGKGFKIGRWAKRFISFATLPADEAYMRSYSYYSTNELRDLFKVDYKPAIELVAHEHKSLFKSKYKDDFINQICNIDTQMFMLGLNLTYTDRASMAASVEVRVPFIDKLMVTKAMQIPGHLKIKRGVSKSILKKAAEKVLPKEIIYRKKASFGAPIRSWIANDLRSMVDELLSEENINKRGFLNYSVVKQMIESDRRGDEDKAYQIYQLLTLELWCREYLDK